VEEFFMGKVCVAYGRELLRVQPRICEVMSSAQGADHVQASLMNSERDVRVTVVQGGTSLNGFYYSSHILAAIARQVDKTQAFVDHGGYNRSVRDVAGFYRDTVVLPPAAGQEHGRVDATLHILENAGWLWSMIQEALGMGQDSLIGLSIDFFGQWKQNDTMNVKEVISVEALNSCDIVTRPSAGGRFHYVISDQQEEQTGIQLSGKEGYETQVSGLQCMEGWAHEEKGLEDQSAASDGFQMETGHTGTSLRPGTAEQTCRMSTAQVSTGVPSGPLGIDQLAEARSGLERLERLWQARLKEQEQMMQESRKMLEMERERVIKASQEMMAELEQQKQLDLCQGLLESRLQGCPLPEPVRERVRDRFTGRIFEAAELEREIANTLEMMALLTKDGLVRGHGYTRPEISPQVTEAEKVQAAFDAMFDLEVESRVGNVKGFLSIREAYSRVTGDATLSAGISGNTRLGQIQVHESAPMGRINEADTTTASFSYLLGSSMNKRLLKDYQSWPAEWQHFVTIQPIRDFKQQSNVRMGSFGSLPVVAENNQYQAVTLVDSAVTYLPQKRGQLVTISREVILNDDLNAIRQIPRKLANAAAYTLAEFVYNFLAGNPQIYDNSPLFTAGAPHANMTASAPLSSSNLQTGVTAIRTQTNSAGKRIGIRPRFLIVPPDLEFTAQIVTGSPNLPGSPNNDINPMSGYVTTIVAPQLATAGQWFLAADPREVDTIVVGFVEGQVNPQLFIQDQPNLGFGFAQDAISYKVRHEYGGAVVDYRGLYRGN
jgi:hypothetical protein